MVNVDNLLRISKKYVGGILINELEDLIFIFRLEGVGVVEGVYSPDCNGLFLDAQNKEITKADINKNLIGVRWIGAGTILDGTYTDEGGL